MEESNLEVELPPTIIDLDSPDGQDSSSPNNPTDQFDNQGRSPVPPTIDLDLSGHPDSSDLQKDEPNSPELQKSALRDENDNNTSRDSSDRRNVRAERKGDTDRVHSRSSDAWATPMDRVHRSSESPISRSISPRGNRPHRNRSRSRSASWSRSRSRSPSGPRRGDWRSPVGGNDKRAPVWGNDRRPPVNAQPCRDFVAGRCRWGQKCRFLHEDGTGTGHDRYDYSRERDTPRGGGRDRDRDNRDREREMYRERERGERERYPSKEDEIYDMRGQREYSRERHVSQGHRSNYDEPPSYEYNNRSSEKCFDFSRGRCKRGADCRFIHDETSSHNNTTVAWGMRERDDRETDRDERGGGRERDRDDRERGGGGGTNYDERERDLSFDGRRGGRKEEICKFFLEGRCGRGQSCRFLHEVAHQVRGENNQNSTNESSWSSQRDNTGSQNQYIVPVPPVNPYLAVPTNLLPPPPPGNPQVRPPPVNLPPPPVNVPVPPPPVIQPNPSNLLTSEQAANITDVSAFLSQIMGRNNSTVPVPVPKPDSPVPVLHESPTTPPVETEKEEAGSSGQKANPNPNPKQGKEAKGLKMFKCALVEVVKDLLKPTWKEGQLSREVHKTIVKKVVDKVIGTMEGSSVPPTQEKIDIYISHSKPKLTKLVQGYVEKYVK